MTARYTLDFTETLNRATAAAITDTVTQCGLYLYSDCDSLTFGLVKQQAARIASLESERDTLRAEVERQTSALKVIYTWAGIPGALKPENVRELSGKALGKATQ